MWRKIPGCRRRSYNTWSGGRDRRNRAVTGGTPRSLRGRVCRGSRAFLAQYLQAGARARERTLLRRCAPHDHCGRTYQNLTFAACNALPRMRAPLRVSGTCAGLRASGEIFEARAMRANAMATDAASDREQPRRGGRGDPDGQLSGNGNLLIKIGLRIRPLSRAV